MYAIIVSARPPRRKTHKQFLWPINHYKLTGRVVKIQVRYLHDLSLQKNGYGYSGELFEPATSIEIPLRGFFSAGHKSSDDTLPLSSFKAISSLSHMPGSTCKVRGRDSSMLLVTIAVPNCTSNAVTWSVVWMSCGVEEVVSKPRIDRSSCSTLLRLYTVLNEHVQ